MPAKPKVRAADVANGDVDGTSATPADAAALERACATIAEKVPNALAKAHGAVETRVGTSLRTTEAALSESTRALKRAKKALELSHRVSGKLRRDGVETTSTSVSNEIIKDRFGHLVSDLKERIDRQVRAIEIRVKELDDD